jgi:hypothetical protein
MKFHQLNFDKVLYRRIATEILTIYTTFEIAMTCSTRCRYNIQLLDYCYRPISFTDVYVLFLFSLSHLYDIVFLCTNLSLKCG